MSLFVHAFLHEIKGEKCHQHSHFSACLSQTTLSYENSRAGDNIHYFEKLHPEPEEILTEVGQLVWTVRQQTWLALVCIVTSMPDWVFKLLKVCTYKGFPNTRVGEARIRHTHQQIFNTFSLFMWKTALVTTWFNFLITQHYWTIWKLKCLHRSFEPLEVINSVLLPGLSSITLFWKHLHKTLTNFKLCSLTP